VAHGYNGNAALATGSTVTITQPDDGDADNAAAQNVPSSRLADWSQRFANFMLGLFGTVNAWVAQQSFSQTGGGAGYTIHVVNSGSGGSIAGDSATGSGPGVTAIGNATRAAENLAPQATPSSPVDGDVWVDSSTNQIKVRINGTIYALGGQLPTPTTVTPQNSWSQAITDGNPARYWKDANGVVHLDGAMNPNGAATSQVAFTLPAGFRPTRSGIIVFFVPYDLATSAQGVTVEINPSNGNVTINYPSNTAHDYSLEGITFATV
jgi:hypothetical protein